MTVGVSLPDTAAVADRRVFTSNGVAFTVADLVRRAQVGGRALSRARTAGEAEEQFRRARGLLTADALEAWLAEWEIDADDFRRWTQDVADGTSTASAWCRLRCSGEFDAIASSLAAGAAAACELGTGPTDTSFDPTGWVERLVTAAATPEALTAAVAGHRLDWTRLTATTLTAEQRSVAEELRHQVVHDGAPLPDAAAAAGLTLAPLDDVLGSPALTELRPVLAGARAGELVGPTATAGGWTLIAVTTRTEPALDDPATLTRATTTVQHDVISRAVARHVVA